MNKIKYISRKSQRSAEYKKALYLQGLCTNCRKPRDSERILCEECREAQTVQIRNRTKNRTEKALCIRCGTPVAQGSKTHCASCWFKKIAVDRTGTMHNGVEIERLFNEQACRCAYTGILLVLGKNAQLDHKIPISRGGSNDIDNLQWVDKEINLMKGNRTHSEFLEICKLISTCGLASISADSSDEAVEAHVLQPWE